MNPFAWFRANALVASLMAGAAAVLAVIAFIYWFADKIGDSRELDVRNSISSQEETAHEAAQKGRARARECHALGADRVWNTAEERCDRIGPVPVPGR